VGYILPEIYKSICQDTNTEVPNIFIETGTFKGGIPHRMLETYGNLDDFKKIYTVELGIDICKVASNRYKLFEKYDGDMTKFNFHIDETDEHFSDSETYFGEKLTLINDNSVNALKTILPNINEPICFWLDAHAGTQKYARGSIDCPLIQELEVIKTHAIKNHIIAIDDAHMFGKREYDKSGKIICDYSKVTYELVVDKILDINPEYDVGIYKPYDMKMIIAFIE